MSGSGATPVGEPVIAAGELEDAAADGEILLGEDTERLLRGTARASTGRNTEQGTPGAFTELKPGRPAVGSLKSPLVGRGASLAGSKEPSRASHDEQTLHLFTILGTAGIGKSRLAQEFAAEAAEKATVVVGRCVPYGEGITFWSLREIVAQLSAGDARGAAPRRTRGRAARPGAS